MVPILLVSKQNLFIPSLKLECGEVLENVNLAYETYGTLNVAKDNAILVFHALTGNAHAAGKYSTEDTKSGWWDLFIGPGKALDTNKYFVICSNVIGGCSGSTGPSEVNRNTKQPFGLSFPVLTITDMVNAQECLISSFGIEVLHACVGGSMGGMQALTWAIKYPSKCNKFIVMAAAAYQSPQNIALHEVGRRAIMNDPNWQNGNYTKETAPNDGLSVARMLAHISYLSDATMHKKFGRRIRNKEELNFELHNEFEVESYLDYQGRNFISRFDANSYLYITRAVDYFDYSENRLREALDTNALKGSKFMVLSFSSDWLYPSYQSLEIVNALEHCCLPVSYCEVSSSYGHDAFLLEDRELTPIISSFIG